MLERALRLRRPGKYQLQAAIAALHVEAPATTRPTGSRSPRSTARSRGSAPRRWSSSTAPPRSDSRTVPQAGLELLEPLLADPALERYQPLHAAHAELLRRPGDAAAADAAYGRAIELSSNAVERAELERRRGGLRGLSPS